MNRSGNTCKTLTLIFVHGSLTQSAYLLKKRHHSRFYPEAKSFQCSLHCINYTFDLRISPYVLMSRAAIGNIVNDMHKSNISQASISSAAATLGEADK